MFQSCGCQVARFCSCSGLKGLAAVHQNPAAAVTTSAAGSAASRPSVRRAKASRNSASTTPDSANPTMTMEITQ